MIFLIDGHSIAFRAFYALPETLETKDGFPTNLIHGFLMMLSKLVNNYDVEKIIITWDVSKKTFRNEIYEDYSLYKLLGKLCQNASDMQISKE